MLLAQNKIDNDPLSSAAPEFASESMLEDFKKQIMIGRSRTRSKFGFRLSKTLIVPVLLRLDWLETRLRYPILRSA
jgi:hypothetical protein